MLLLVNVGISALNSPKLWLKLITYLECIIPNKPEPTPRVLRGILLHFVTERSTNKSTLEEWMRH